MRNKCEVFKTNFYRFLSRLVKEYKYYIITFTIFFIIAFVTGIFSAAKYSSDLTEDNFINGVLLEFLKKEKGFWGLFFSYFIWAFVLSVFAILFTNNILCNIIETLGFMLFSYIIGFDLTVMFFSFGIVGIIFSILVYGLIIVIVSFTIILIFSIATKNMRTQCFSRCGQKEIIKLYLFLMGFQVFLLIVFCIMLSFLHIFIIIE